MASTKADVPEAEEMKRSEENGEDSLASLETTQGIDRRKLMVLVNHFIVSTTGFVNRLHRVSEKRLRKISRDVTRLDVSLKILEAKLSSIKGLESVKANTPSASKADTSSTTGVNVASQDTSGAPATKTSGSAANSSASTSQVVNSATCPPQYAKYFKLLEMMMPLENVKLKCASEGLDPSVLDQFGSSTGVSAAAAPAALTSGVDADASKTADSKTDTGSDSTQATSTDVVVAVAAAAPTMKVQDDPTFKPFFKMLRIGVPIPHIKAKMAAHGVDPSVIDLDPNSPSPNGGNATAGAIEG